MNITYLRSSAIGTHKLCEQQYFLSYILGIPQIPNHKAEKGTVTHKVFECLALDKFSQQNGKPNYIDDSLGELKVGTSPEDLLNLSFDHYSSKSPNEWTEKDREDCLEWVHTALTFQGGNFDPRNRNIFAAEQHFDFSIDKPWATYDFSYRGQKLEGQLSLKGTIDLITKINDTTLEVVDWKTGRRWDWAKDKVKTYRDLQDDFQLRMYHYALSHLFPEIKTILVSIYFINGFWNGTKKDGYWVPGGVYTVAFAKHDLKIFEERLEKMYAKIVSTQKPELTRSWKCTSFCHFGKNLYPGSNLTICDFIKRRTQEMGINKVIEQFSDPNHHIDVYQAPGE